MGIKYSILLLKDNAGVRRFRVHSSLLLCVAVLLGALFAVAACGGYAGYIFWQHNGKLIAENTTLQKNIRDLTIDLKRLENVEKILNANDPEELQALLDTTAGKDAPRLSPPIDLSTLLHVVDMQMVKVNNVSASLQGKQEIQLQFDLNSQTADRMLQGSITVALISKQGQTQPATVSNPEEMSYSISRYKKVTANLQIPPPMSVEDIYALAITISANGDTVFHDTIPLHSLL